MRDRLRSKCYRQQSNRLHVIKAIFEHTVKKKQNENKKQKTKTKQKQNKTKQNKTKQNKNDLMVGIELCLALNQLLYQFIYIQRVVETFVNCILYCKYVFTVTKVKQ